MAKRLPVDECDVSNWLGGDNTLAEAIDVIVKVANGEFKPKLLRQNIEDYNEAETMEGYDI